MTPPLFGSLLNIKPDVRCNERCPSCRCLFTILSQFVRHKCTTNSTSSELLKNRVAWLTKDARAELDCKIKKRAHLGGHQDSSQPQKMRRSSHKPAINIYSPARSSCSQAMGEDVVNMSGTIDATWPLPQRASSKPAMFDKTLAIMDECNSTRTSVWSMDTSSSGWHAVAPMEDTNTAGWYLSS